MLDWLAASWTEILGFATGLTCVYLAARRNVWTFPIGIANNLVFIWLFLGTALYGEAALQLVYIVLGVAGWVAWSRARATAQPFVRHAPRAALGWLVLAGAAATLVIAWALHAHTDSVTEVPDAATTAFSLVAQVMLNKRWLESWYVWIAVDVALVVLLAVKGLTITAALYLVFIGLCVTGLRGWRAEMLERAGQPEHAEPAEVAP